MRKILFMGWAKLLFALAWGLCMPLSAWSQIKFIPNQGQWNGEIRYRADVSGGALFVLDNSLRYHFMEQGKMHELMHGHTGDTVFIGHHGIFVEWVNASPSPIIIPDKPSTEYYNYYLSNDAARWATGLHAYSNLRYNELYPGIDMLVESQGDQLKYTYYVAPGADPKQIQLKIEGADEIYLKDKALHIKTRLNTIIENPPYAYQQYEGGKEEIPCHFELEGNTVSIRISGKYDKKKPLVIDPRVIFASYSGSKADNFGFTGTYDSLGNGYAGGTVYGPGFLYTAGFFQDTFRGGKSINPTIGNIARDASIMKYTPDGKSLHYATYLGGSSNEQPHSMVVNSRNQLVVFGTTYSNDFPVTNSSSYKGETDIFICKFSENGKKLLRSTYFGGSHSDGLNGLIPNGVRNQSPLGYNYGDQFRGEVIVDEKDFVYVASTTFSNDFPVVAGSAQTSYGGKQDGCVFKFDSTLNNLQWSTYLGDTGYDAAYGLSLDKTGNVFVCGGSTSGYFFNDNTAYQTSFQGDSSDGYICHISKDGKQILDATFLGTIHYDQTYFIQLDDNQNVYVYGQTRSPATFPLVKNKYYNPNSGQFISKFDYKLEKLLLSTLFGSGRGIPDISPTAFLVDDCGKIYISGWGGETNEEPLGNGGYTSRMPITSDAYQKTSPDSSDFYVAVFAREMDTVLYASYFGGPLSGEHVDGGTSRFDKKGIIYQSVCGGCFGNSDFPVTDSAWSKVNGYGQGCNDLLFKVDLEVPDLVVDFDVKPSGCTPFVVKPVNKSRRAKSYIWDFGDGSHPETAFEPLHAYAQGGEYTITLIAINPLSCVVQDTIKKKVKAYLSADAEFEMEPEPCTGSVNFTATGSAGTWTWDFGDGTTGISGNVQHTYAKKDSTYIIKLTGDAGTACEDFITDTISFKFPKATFAYLQDTCRPVLQFANYSKNAVSYLWDFGTGDSSTEVAPKYNFGKKGEYTVTLIATDTGGCADTTVRQINVNDRPHAGFDHLVDTCSGGVRFIAYNDVEDFIWHFGDGTTSTERDVLHFFPQIMEYEVMLISNAGGLCADTASVKVTPARRPIAAFELQQDTCTNIVRVESLSYRAYSYLWDFGDNAKDSGTRRIATHQYPNKGKYTITLVVNPGTPCADTAEHEVEIRRDLFIKIDIPNIFTPNDDGKNDHFKVGRLSGCTDYKIEIYNRWGQLMYEEYGNKISWDGKYLGNADVPEGVYYYVLTGPDDLVLKGTVTVVR